MELAEVSLGLTEHRLRKVGGDGLAALGSGHRRSDREVSGGSCSQERVAPRGKGLLWLLVRLFRRSRAQYRVYACLSVRSASESGRSRQG